MFVFATLALASAWMVFSRQFTLGAFVVGIALGAGILLLIRANTSKTPDDQTRPKFTNPLKQLGLLVFYFARLTWDIVLSGFEVARLALSTDPKTSLATQMSLISTQDEGNSVLVSALSAHAITITPGSLVVDYEKIDGQEHMRVHVLNSKTTPEERLIADQTKRAALLKRILGL